MTEDEIWAVEQAITRPGQRLIIALAAIHAAPWKAVQALTLDDLDLPNRRITSRSAGATSTSTSSHTASASSASAVTGSCTRH